MASDSPNRNFLDKILLNDIAVQKGGLHVCGHSLETRHSRG